MIQPVRQPRRRGRKPVDPAKRHVTAPWSLPQWLIDRVGELADEEDSWPSAVALRLLVDALATADARKRMEAA